MFAYLYLIGLAIGLGIRTYYGRKYKQDQPETATQGDRKDRIFLSLISLGFILPMIYPFVDWFAFAEYPVPEWVNWLGTAIFFLGVYVLWRSHVDLGKHWSPELALRQDHQLVDSGVFRLMRHPMYAAHFYWSVGQLLMLSNWLVGPSMFVFMLPFLLHRIPLEEKMMIGQFGKKYEEYIKRTGRLFPRF
jgi:protein-S-isoprenylcysteine O-methyltransferase Ste14